MSAALDKLEIFLHLYQSPAWLLSTVVPISDRTGCQFDFLDAN